MVVIIGFCCGFFFWQGGSYGLNVKVRGIWKIVHASTELLTAVSVVLFRIGGLKAGSSGG